jgi:hypothetical protein
MSPVNFLDRSLKRYAFGEGEHRTLTRSARRFAS